MLDKNIHPKTKTLELQEGKGNCFCVVTEGKYNGTAFIKNKDLSLTEIPFEHLPNALQVQYKRLQQEERNKIY